MLKSAVAAAKATMLRLRYLSLRPSRLRVAPIDVDCLGNGSRSHNPSPQHRFAQSIANSAEYRCSQALEGETARADTTVSIRNEMHIEVRDGPGCWGRNGNEQNENRDINKEEKEEDDLEWAGGVLGRGETKPRNVVEVDQLLQGTWTDTDLEQKGKEGLLAPNQKLDAAAFDCNSCKLDGTADCQCINRADNSCCGAEAGKAQQTPLQDEAIDEALDNVFIHFVSHPGGCLDTLKGSIYQALACSSAGSVWFTRYF
jgi:hypothetical protein